MLARVYAGRRIRSASELRYEASGLVEPRFLKSIDEAARLLADAIQAGKRLLIVADYDADGATACAVGVRALRMFGATVDYLVPDRFKLGYGLSPELVELAAAAKPDLLITVDNGIASVEGVARARELGIATLITDHHLPGPELPAAECIVNPNQPGCEFPSKALAGVGVMFYVMLALRAELRKRSAFRVSSRIWARSPTSWRSAPSPTSCRSMRTTATWCRRGSSGCAPGAVSRESWRCCAPRAGRSPKPRASISDSSPGRGSTRRDGLPTCGSASNA